MEQMKKPCPGILEYYTKDFTLDSYDRICNKGYRRV